MALVDHKSGAAAVDPDDHNAVVDAVVALQAGGGGGSLPAGGTTGEVLTKASDADGDADWQTGGGGEPAGIQVVRFPVAFDTPGLVPDSFPIIAVDVPGLTITVAGDRRAAFAVGVSFVIAGSSANDQSGTVVSASLDGGDTVIDGMFFFLDPTADGDAVVAVGATVYTPAVGDILIGSSYSPLTLVSVSEAWDGATPKLKVLTEAYRRAQFQPFVNLDATVADDPAGASLVLSASPGFSFGEPSQWRLWRFTTADPILVQVDDNNGADPGATQGAAEIVLLILPAA